MNAVPAAPAEPMSYIARCRVCGGTTMATMDTPGHARDVSRLVAEHIRAGDTIDRVTSDYVRQNWKSCTCVEPPAGQPAALLE